MEQDVSKILGEKLPTTEAKTFIDSFRNIYHGGVAEKQIDFEKWLNLSPNYFKNQKLADNRFIPSDILQYRMENYDEQYRELLSTIRPEWMGMILTVGTFKTESITTTSMIFHHSRFLEYDKLVITEWSTGKSVWLAQPLEIREFLNGLERKTNVDYYIFPKELTWCIVATHHDEYVFASQSLTL